MGRFSEPTSLHTPKHRLLWGAVEDGERGRMGERKTHGS